MGVIPMVLGAIGTPLVLTYKSAKMAFSLRGAGGSVLAVADGFASFALDINGKVGVSLAWLVIKFAYGKRRCHQLATKTCAWIKEHRSPLKGKGLEADLNAWLSADPSASASSGVQPDPDPLTRGGLLFLRDCLARLQTGENHAASQFLDPSTGKLDLRTALLAFYSTPAAQRLAEALAAPGACATPLQSLIDNVYVDLRLALRRDLVDMFVL